ncbi:hypothetical protein [Asticcacaulis machinosus]|uniref:DUF7847 domain-containing protein n=1 Tax=Asticcacaulis machinosus TaxID=2984211 RepID=A0ABT5HK17_9CAUL|nr:hypothetical protein [Asticcacaulis machinosus]MDC7676595.1 hypothetical protein [Asticcacaulis machinosus]
MKFTIGNTLNEGFALLGQYFGQIAVAGLLLYVLPMTAAVLGLFSSFGFDLQNPSLQLEQGVYLPFGIYMGMSVLTALLSLSVLTEIIVKGEAKQPFNLGASIGRGFINIIPLIIVGILSTLLMMVGLILLIIPGFIVMLGLYVATTVYIAEPGIGIIGAMKRSWALTKNHRWQIFLILLIIGILCALAGGAFGLPLGLMAATIPPMVSLTVQMIISSVTSLVTFVFAVAIYLCLRRAKDTHTPETVANVFS